MSTATLNLDVANKDNLSIYYVSSRMYYVLVRLRHKGHVKYVADEVISVPNDISMDIYHEFRPVVQAFSH